MATISLDSPAALVAAIRRTRRPSGQGDSHDFALTHRAPNGRLFEIREYEDGRFFMSELRPNGRGLRPNGTYAEIPALKRVLDDPNGFVAAARAAGLDEDGIVRGGQGLGVATRYFPDLAAVVEAIRGAIAENRWYDSVDRELLRDPAFLASLAEDEEVGRAAWETQKQAEHARAVAEGEGIFKGLHSMRGPLPKERRDLILAYLNAPDEAGWEAIAHTCVKGMTTLWQAWLKVDPEAPRSKSRDGAWPRIPEPETLREAMRDAAGLARDERPDGEAEIVALRR